MHIIEHHAIAAASHSMGGTEWIKQELLMHDKIGMLHLDECIGQLHMYGTSIKSQRAETYEFLKDKGLIYEACIPERPANKEVEAYLSSAMAQYAMLDQQLAIAGLQPQGNKSEAYDAIREADYRLQCHLARAVAINLQQEQFISAVPLLQSDSLQDNSPFLRKTPVLRAVIRELPMPDETVSLQEILEIRLDPDFIDKRNRLRTWIRKISTEEWSEQDIREEIYHLASEYEKYMRLNGIKYSLNSFGAVVKFGAGLVEDALKLKFKDLTESLFTIVGESANLCLAEMGAPGREVALIPHLRSEFRNS